jgi:hypothetical protein
LAEYNEYFCQVMSLFGWSDMRAVQALQRPEISRENRTSKTAEMRRNMAFLAVGAMLEDAP